MRTTVSIDDALLAEAKRLALERHCSLGEVLTEALRQLVIARKSSRKASSTRLTTFKGKGIQPGVDLDSNASLADLMEER
jgi:Arc/MetJ family transcription regulator